MTIIDKFAYCELKRTSTNEGRKYTAPDGSKLASVTTILDATKSIESKQALNNWRKRVGQQKAKEITTEAAGRGTRMHKWLENYVLSGDTGEPGSHPASKQSHKMAHIIIEKGLVNCNEFWGTEVALYFPGIYAGTTDMVGLHNNQEAILDFKQTNKPKKREWIDDYFLQLAAYAECHNEVYSTNINKGVVMMCSADYEYQEFVIEGTEFDNYTSLWWKRVEQYYKTFLQD